MKTNTSPWTWITSLYFAQGLPYVIVMTTAVIMFKRLGINNTDIALYTSWLYLPWVIKPLWSPFIDIFKRKRWWIVTMQLLIGGGLSAIAMVLPGPEAFRHTLACMWLLAFSSATHDIAVDGFYLLALDEKKQAYFVGIRNLFYRLAVIAGQGLIVVFAGNLEKQYSEKLPADVAITQAWSVTFYLLAGLFLLLFLYHHLFLPHPKKDCPAESGNSPAAIAKAFGETFADFFTRPHIISALAFILLYRLAESQLVKITSPFLMDQPETGGLALSTAEIGWIYGTIGVSALVIGGILGGIAIARKGLKYWIWTMTIALNLPNLLYWLLAWTQTSNTIWITASVGVEQLGYGFGFTSLTFFMMRFTNGKHQTAHYALCTGFMALGMMLPGMASGWIQETIGYQNFFAWIMISTLPSFIATYYIRKWI